MQVDERSCPWCTTAYPAGAEPAPDISATWNEDEDPSYGTYWVGAGMPRPSAGHLYEISGSRATGAQWDAYLRHSIVDRPAALVTSGAMSANEARELAEDWERAHRSATSSFGLSAADTQKPRTDDPLLLAIPTARPLKRPQAPLGRFVIDSPWPFREAIDWLKGLFK